MGKSSWIVVEGRAEVANVICISKWTYIYLVLERFNYSDILEFVRENKISTILECTLLNYNF